MQLTIEKVIDAQSGQVEFNSEFGQARGRWSGTLPVPGQTYYVELDVDKVLTCGSDLVAVGDGHQTSIHCEGDSAILVGLLERVEDDGVAILRLGQSVIMLEIEGDGLPTPGWVRAGPVVLSISDMNY